MRLLVKDAMDYLALILFALWIMTQVLSAEIDTRSEAFLEPQIAMMELQAAHSASMSFHQLSL